MKTLTLLIQKLQTLPSQLQAPLRPTPPRAQTQLQAAKVPQGVPAQRRPYRAYPVALVFFIMTLLPATAAAAVNFQAGIDHSDYQALLKRYVDADGLIAYQQWGANAADTARLHAYLKHYEAKPTAKATGADYQAGLINLYNAVTIKEVLRTKPSTTFWVKDDMPFPKKIHLVGGEKVSLDMIEHEAARPAIGYRVHIALVCAALSCPPLIQTAYTADNIEELLNESFKAWLQNPALNKISDKGLQLSKLFEWFKSDFDQAGGIKAVLKKHSPSSLHAAIDKHPIAFLDYNTGLNTQ